MKTNTDNKSPFPSQYAKNSLLINYGKGVYLYDYNGNKYLDFGSGIAVNAFGSGRKDFAKIAFSQMKKLVHVSNLFTTKPSVAFANKLLQSGDFDAVHFGNSGTEANEAAMKYARLYAQRKKGKDCNDIICFEGGFHGRTMGSLSVTPNKKFREPFLELISGVQTLPYNDVAMLKKCSSSKTAAIIVEVVQGEGGLSVMTTEFAEAINAVAAEHDITVIVDEVQTGLGRINGMYAHLHIGLKADVLTLSKPLAGGLPLSATLIPSRINEFIKLGEHGTTFGGGPVTTAVALHIWDLIHSPGFFEKVQVAATHLENRLKELQEKHTCIKALRGAGMLRGIVLEKEGVDSSALVLEAINASRKNGLLVLKSGVNALRIAPPLTINRKQIDIGIMKLDAVIQNL